MLLQRMRATLPRVAAGAAIVSPVAYYIDWQLNHVAQCEPDADIKIERRALVKRVTANYGHYGKSFMELLEVGERKQLEPGEYLFQRGDAATHLYLILSGELHLLAHEGQSGETHHIDTLGPGGICGENALLEKNPTRSRTIVAHSKCDAIMIDKDSFEKKLHEVNTHIKVDGSSGARILAFINMVCPVLPRTVRRNEVLFRQGDHTHSCLYIVNTGALDVLQKDKFRRDVKTDSIHEGECFGYVSLLNPDLHSEKEYTIKCTTASSELLVIQGEDFHRLLDHSRVVSTLMKNLTRLRKEHAKDAIIHAGVTRFRGW